MSHSDRSLTIEGFRIASTGLARDLAVRAQEGTPVRVGLIGAGEMGTDLVTQIALMRGMEVAAIACRTPLNAHKALKIAGLPADSAQTVRSADALNHAIEEGVMAVTDDVDALLASGHIDVVVEATGIPEVGAETAMKAIRAHKHVVMMNVEADVTIGPYLKSQADTEGVVYTIGAGDEPSACMELIEFVDALGYPIVAAGKGKNNPMQHDAIPDDYLEEAQRRNMNVRMLVEFIEGSKTMVEMAVIANATGLLPDIPGMHGPNAPLDDLCRVLIPKHDGGILSASGRVDYSVGGGICPGVFVVADLSHPRLRERLHDLKLGAGPYYTFYRPYHLTSLEVPLSCARAVLYGTADMVPLPVPTAEVCAVAKKDLKAGDTLDFIGMYTYRAWTMTLADARVAQAIPCGLLQGATVTAPIQKGALITTHNARVKEGTVIGALRVLQDVAIAGKT